MGKVREEFEGFLESFFEALGIEKVTTEDLELLLGFLEKRIRRLDRARRGLGHYWSRLDDRGRITITKDMRVRLGWESGSMVDVHLWPNPQRPKGLLLIKEAF